MRCTDCQFENRQGRRFCSECGAPLDVICPDCGFANNSDEKFCGGCGTRLGPASPQPAKIDHPISPAAERRQLTVMFCDLVGSTALAERIDPEELRDHITEFQKACVNAVERYEGYVARYMGDGLLVYFGYPAAREDDAERAILTGLHIVEGLAGRNATGGEKLEVRIGIATGLVVAGDIVGEGASEEHAVLGETPNLAARFQGLAEPGTIVIGAATRRLAEGMFIFDDLGPQTVKGVAAPVAAYRVCEATEARNRFEAAAQTRLTPLVGRNEEIGLLLGRWKQAKDGEGQIVLLSAEPGLGKSRISRDLRDRLEGEPHHRVLCFCSPFYQNSAFHPVIQQLRRRFGFERDDTDETKLDKIDADLKRHGLPVEEHAPVLAALLSVATDGRYQSVGLNAEQMKRASLDTLTVLVEASAADQPLLLIIEDLHWMDPSTLEFVGQVIERIHTLPVMAVLTSRPEFVSPWGRHSHLTELSLNRLGRKESLRIVDELTGGKPLPEAVLDDILTKTDGVPLFVEELTKAVLESNLLEETREGYVLRGLLAPVAIPSSLQDSLMARLDNLAPVKEVAQFAAILGRTFSHEILFAVAPFPENRLEDALDRLLEAGLIYRRGRPPEAAYEFKHALVCDVAYQSLLKSRRAEFHFEIASAMEIRFPRMAENQPELLAHHFSKGGHTDRALDYWHQAGMRAIDRFANAEAIAHLSKGAEALLAMPPGDARAKRELSFNFALATAMRVVERLDEALLALVRAEAVAKELNLPEDLSHIYHLRGNLSFPLGRIDQCSEAHALALDFARKANSAKAEARALGGMADAAYARGHMKTANGYFQQCVKLSQEHGFGTIEAANLSMVGFTSVYLLDASGANEAGFKAVDAAKKDDHLRAELLGEAILYNTFFEMGDLGRAGEHVNRAQELSKKIGARRFEGENLLYRGKICRAEGNLKEARESFAEAMQACRETGVSFMGPWVLAEMAAEAEDPEMREKYLAEGQEILAGGVVSHCQFWFHRVAMDICCRIRDWDRMDRYATALEDFTRNEPLPWTEYFVARGRALAAYGRGDRSEANLAEIARLHALAKEAQLTTPRALLKEILNNRISA